MTKKITQQADEDKQPNTVEALPTETLDMVFGRAMNNPVTAKGIRNLSMLAPLDVANQSPRPYKGKPFTRAEINFSSSKSGVRIALAAEGAMPRYIPLPKFVGMVEHMDNPKFATMVLQNHQAPAENREGRGQVLGRILPEHSAINIALGNQAVAIRDESDILRIDSFQIDRGVLTTYYLASRYQIEGEDRLNELIASYDGIRYFNMDDGAATVPASVAGLLG